MSKTIDAGCFDELENIEKRNSADTHLKCFVGYSGVGAIPMLLRLLFSDVKLRTTAKHPGHPVVDEESLH